MKASVSANFTTTTNDKKKKKKKKNANTTLSVSLTPEYKRRTLFGAEKLLCGDNRGVLNNAWVNPESYTYTQIHTYTFF